MSVFNQNMRFMRLKLGLSQEKFAQSLGIKRGRLAPYEDKSSGDPEFYRILVEKHDINLHKFLIVEMNDDNFSSFFTSEDQNVVREDAAEYLNKSQIIDIIQLLKSETDIDERNRLADKAISLIARLMDENSQLHKEILDLVKKSR